MSTINVETGGLHDAAERLRTLAGDLHDGQERTLKLVGCLKEDISGTRITALITQTMLNIQKEYDKMHENYLQYAQFLHTAATTYELTDSNLKRIMAAFAGAIASTAVTGSSGGSGSTGSGSNTGDTFGVQGGKFRYVDQTNNANGEWDGYEQYMYTGCNIS